MGFDRLSPNGVDTSPCRINKYHGCQMRRGTAVQNPAAPRRRYFTTSTHRPRVRACLLASYIASTDNAGK